MVALRWRWVPVYVSVVALLPLGWQTLLHTDPLYGNTFDSAAWKKPATTEDEKRARREIRRRMGRDIENRQVIPAGMSESEALALLGPPDTIYRRDASASDDSHMGSKNTVLVYEYEVGGYLEDGYWLDLYFGRDGRLGSRGGIHGE